jgi:hypothetical protein
MPGPLIINRRPYLSINTLWGTNDVAYIRDDATFPTADDTTYIAASDSDDNESQQYYLAIFGGVPYIFDQLIVKVRALYSTSNVLSVSLSIGGVELARTALTLTTSFADYTITYAGQWSMADLVDWQVNFISGTIASAGYLRVSLASVDCYGYRIYPQMV